jgi:hypothetical protein
MRDMHRPILFSGTATNANVISRTGHEEKPIGVELDHETADYIYHNILSDAPSDYIGEVTGYNSRTFKGRIFVATEHRILSFFLEETCRSASDLLLITRSLTADTQKGEQYARFRKIRFRALTYKSKSGRLKSFRIISVAPLQA